MITKTVKRCAYFYKAALKGQNTAAVMPSVCDASYGRATDNFIRAGSNRRNGLSERHLNDAL